MAEKWIAKADIEEGAFTKKAKAHNMGVQEFAAHVLANEDKFDTKTIKQANLAKTFKKMAKGVTSVSKGRRIGG